MTDAMVVIYRQSASFCRCLRRRSTLIYISSVTADKPAAVVSHLLLLVLSIVFFTPKQRLLMYVVQTCTTLPFVSNSRCRCYWPHLIIFFSLLSYFFGTPFGSSGGPWHCGAIRCITVGNLAVVVSVIVLYCMFADVISSTDSTCNLLLSDYPRTEMRVLIARLKLAPHKHAEYTKLRTD